MTERDPRLEPWLTMEQAAEVLGVTRNWVSDAVSARAIPHHRLGRYIRFTADDIELLKRQTSVQPVKVGRLSGGEP